MKKILTALLIITVISCQFSKNEVVNNSDITTVYYFIRHAEKDRSDTSQKDPELTKIGIQRAKNWATLFEKVEFDQIFSTDYRRTQQTVKYVSIEQKVAVHSYDPNDLYNDDFKTLTAGKTILIVGHSNTTPEFVNAILGIEKFPHIADSNNANLYIVSIIENTRTVQLLTVN